MLKFSTLHYEKSWFTAIFSIMKRVVMDAKSGQPVISFKQTWGNSIQVFGDPQFSSLMLEARFIMKAALEWNLFEVGKAEPFGKMVSHIFLTALALGGEAISVTAPDGKPLIIVEREGNTMMKHLVDNMSNLYNPTHVYTFKKPGGGEIGKVAMKHGILKSVYDFELTGGTEKERAAALLVFGYLLLMLKK